MEIPRSRPTWTDPIAVLSRKCSTAAYRTRGKQGRRAEEADRERLCASGLEGQEREREFFVVHSAKYIPLRMLMLVLRVHGGPAANAQQFESRVGTP